MSWRAAARDAALVVALSALMALAFNAARGDDGIPLIAREPYRIFVPCPEPVGEVTPVEVDELEPGSERVLWIDAREPAAYAAWHLDGAESVPFDFLDPVPAETVARLVASQRLEVVVYGDGGEPDTGEQLARELSGRGMRNVQFVVGGAPALGGEGTP